MSDGGLAGARHVFDPPLIAGRLVRRYKRFLAEVTLADGQVVTAHCPNSGSMLGCDPPDAPVRLSPAANPQRRTKYGWEMVLIDDGWVGINTALPNELVAQAARLRALPLFADALEARREVKVSAHARLDLLVQTSQGPLWVEVKNVTLKQGPAAAFPDARTERGAKHLRELARLKAQGDRAALVFVVQRGDVEFFAPARAIDPDYATELGRAVAAGVEIVVVQARVEPQAVTLWRQLPARLDR